MPRRIIYRNPFVYRLCILLLYHRRYITRFRIVADLVPKGSDVLDLGCGPGLLYELCLRDKDVDYMGLDVNETFIEHVRNLGAQAYLWDLRKDDPLPQADYIVMQGSLLHFLPDPYPIVNRMLRAARKQVIVSEPIRNIGGSNSPMLAAVGRWLTDPGTGKPAGRFTEETLDGFFKPYARHVEKSLLLSGGREKVYVLNRHAAARPKARAAGA
jgi:SAM-dependent methyltransferase